MKHTLSSLLAFFLAVGSTATAANAGLLTAKGNADAPIRIVDHQVQVAIIDGFSRTQVTQTFYNPNPVDLEAVYSTALPPGAALAEVEVLAGETTIEGEVVAALQAEQIYDSEVAQGRQAALAAKNDIFDFRFFVSPVLAGQHVEIRFVYLQPLEIDTGVGRYVYLMDPGGTDDRAADFWLDHGGVDGTLSVDVDLRSSAPISELRAPGHPNARIDSLEDGSYQVRWEAQGGTLEEDFVLYYRLQEGLPAQVEMLTYRADPNESGTFMLVLTPGLDLQPLRDGVDYSFILDVSSSMSGKLPTLRNGMKRAIGKLRPEDRYRVALFNNRASWMTDGWLAATPENVANTLEELDSLRTGGSTNLYEGLDLGLSELAEGRTTNIVLVTDGVTNTGVVDPQEFHSLMKTSDVRLFGFLLGNSGNWPLMRTICDASGGFYKQISNGDDLLGQILLAKNKVTHEALHDVALSLEGVGAWGTTQLSSKVHHGEQVVLFGRYDQPGAAKVELRANISGEERVYETIVDFPEADEREPELERLWALRRIDDLSRARDAGLLPAGEVRPMIQDLGVEYQIVTDYTSMIVLTEDAFVEHGLERRNRDRLASEASARDARASAPSAIATRRRQPAHVSRSSPVTVLGWQWSRRSRSGGRRAHRSPGDHGHCRAPVLAATPGRPRTP